MPRGRLNRLAITAVLIFAIAAFAACDGNSNEFQQKMGLLLFEQARLAVEFDRVLDPLFQEITASGDLRSPAQSFSKRREQFLSTQKEFIRIANDWEALEPPREAADFYQRTLEMINLRVSSLKALVTAEESAAISGRLDLFLISEAGRNWAEALVIWPEVLANANSFNAGDLGN